MLIWAQGPFFNILLSVAQAFLRIGDPEIKILLKSGPSAQINLLLKSGA
jgi:hypothetical protein